MSDPFKGLVVAPPPEVTETTIVQKEGERLDGYGDCGQWWSGGGFSNRVTGLGTFNRDKVLQGSFLDPVRISDPELSGLFNGYGLAARIVETRPNMALSKGYSLTIPSDDNPRNNLETAKLAEKYAAKLRVNELFRKAAIFGNLFGGCILLAGLDDGQDPSEPLRRENIKSLRFLNLIDRRFLYALSYYGDPTAGPLYGEVEKYRVTNMFGDQQSTVIHESRLIRFDGSEVEIYKKRMLAGWSLSKLQRPYDTLRAYGSSIQALSNLLTDASQGVFKIRGLNSAIAGGNAQKLETRMMIADMQRSSGRGLMLDAEQEDFKREPTSFAGIPESIRILMQLVASDAEQPMTRLFGMSPAGLNATGESDEASFYDSLKVQQNQEYEPKLIRLFEWIFLAKDGPTRGELPDEFKITWNPLSEETPAEKATKEKTIADRDVVYINAGVWLAEEVALARADGKLWNDETEIDIDERKRSLTASIDLATMGQEIALKSPPQLEELSPEEPSNPQQAPMPGSPAEDPKFRAT